MKSMNQPLAKVSEPSQGFPSAIVLLVVGLVTYRPALDIGFWTDDYVFLDLAGRLALPDYLTFYFDPRLQSQWYRPMQGMQWWVMYALFHHDAMGYHLVQLAIHLASCLLLYALIARITQRWHLAFLAVLVYVTLPAYMHAVFWPGVADPLTGLFYLLTIWLWVDYLQIGGGLRFALTVVAYVGALLCKEISATLPITLLLADLWLVGKPTRLVVLLKRYALFFLLLAIYALLEFQAVTRGVFTQELGYGFGSHIVSSLIQHLSRLAFPWGMSPPWSYAWLAVLLALFGYAAVRRVKPVLFLGAAAVLTMLPVLPFPANMAQAPRYLYLPLMASAVGVAMLIEGLTRHLSSVGRTARPPLRASSPRNIPLGRALRVAVPLAVALLVAWSSAIIAEEAVSFAGVARETRLQFRPIYQRHSSFAPGTFLYFIDLPFIPQYASGMMFLRYGPNVTVSGTGRNYVAGLRDHNAAFVFYLDDQNVWQEQAVDRDALVHAAPDLPAEFGGLIALDDFELASARVRRGDALVLVTYWRGLGKIDKDYAVFTHLVAANGQMVAGADRLLRRDNAPTSVWKINQLAANGIVVPIGADVPPGEYRIELGVYDPATMQRFALIDASGQPLTDKIVIAPVSIIE